MAIQWTGLFANTGYSSANNKTQDDAVTGMQDTLYVTGPGYGAYEAVVNLHNSTGATVATVNVSGGGGAFSAPPPVRFVDNGTVYSYSLEVVRGYIPTEDADGIVIRLVGGAAKRYPSPMTSTPSGDVAFQGAVKAAAPVNPYAYAVVPCSDIDGRFTDASGRGNDLFPDTSNSTAFATAGYISSVASTFGGVVLTPDKFQWNPVQEWLVFSFAFKKAAPGASQTILSVGASASAGYYGFYLSHRTSGSLKIVPVRNGTVDGALSDSRLSFSDSTPQDRQVTIAYDPKIGAFYLWRDGILSDAFLANKQVGANAFADANLTYRINFGGLAGAGDASLALSCFRNIHIYKGIGNLPVSVGEIVQKLTQAPSVIAPYDAFVFPSKRVRLTLIGQSNEQGPGPTNYNSVHGRGGPMRDTIPPNGGYNSWWPAVSEMMGSRGIWLEVGNTAYGSTGITDWWTGRCRAWVGGMLVTSGSFVTYGGNTYRAVTAGGTALPIGGGNTSAIITSVATPAVGGDANLTWTSLGASLAIDTDGKVYASTDAGRWDPNGMIANAITANSSTTNPGFDVYGVYISIGQGDKSMGVTRTQYAQALQNAASYITAQGLIAVIGLTCNGNTAGLSAWFASTGKPGWQDALSALSSNSKVFAGADLYTTLGTLPDETVANDPVPKMQADQLHLNSSARILAARKIDASFAAVGL